MLSSLDPVWSQCSCCTLIFQVFFVLFLFWLLPHSFPRLLAVQIQEAGTAKFKKAALEYALAAAANQPTGTNPTVDLFDDVFKGLSK